MISINNKKINVVGNNITISNGKVIVDGKEVSDLSEIEGKQITINIEAKVDSLSVDNGIVNAKDVGGDVVTKNGNIQCSNVQGNVTSKNGNIKANTVHGDCETKNGNISR